MKDFATDALTVGVIGAGIMGRGVAQIAASAGLKVILNDVNEEATNDALKFITGMIDRAVEKGRMEKSDAEIYKNNLGISSSIEDLADADVVIEAIVERVDIKQAVFKELEKVVSDECILATNTSSLSVTSIATAVADQTRVAGAHFFNPVPLMKLVEVINGVNTSPAVIEQLVLLVERMGHTPVKVIDTPGFLVNHMGRGLITEGLRILSENIAQPVDVDEVMRECLGFRMGPFELMDLTALDVTCPVSEQVYEQYYHEPRLRPTPLLRQRMTAGLYGRKVGQGFYRYEEGKKIEPETEEFPEPASMPKIWISRYYPEFYDRISAILQQSNIEIDHADSPLEDSIALVTPLGNDCTSQCIDEDLDPQTTMAVDALFLSESRICVMTNPATGDNARNAVCHAFLKSGRKVSCLNDSAGTLAQRILANIVNTVCEIAQQGIARPEDIDKAAKLGLGYPDGPLSLGDKTGAATLLEILENMQAVYGDPRYRPSIWLKRRAMLGLSLLHSG